MPALRRLLGTNGYLISECCTLGLVCYAAEKLWYETRFPAVTWIAVILLWLGKSATGAMGKRSANGPVALTANGCLGNLFAACLCALAVKAFAAPFSWTQAGAFALVLLAGLGATRVFFGLIARSGPTDKWEGLRMGTAQGVALFAVHPFVRSAILGAGDAMSYSMMVADFRAQRSAGVFPILIGQSPFAFNGGFQPIRNAPFFQHLAWVWDALSLGTLNVFALQNLTVLASMLGTVLGCYAAVRISQPGRPWLALSLAVLYGLCPGVLAPLYEGDMYITFMTLPFIPWLVLGIEQSSGSPDRIWPWFVQGASLAGMWLAHPPVAAWATLLTAAADVWTLVRNPRWRIIRRMILVPAVLVVLGGYLFVSVNSLGLPLTPRPAALASIDYKIATLHGDWLNSFLPLDRSGSHLLGDVQLGYGLWASLLLALAGAATSRPGRVLLGCFALILLFAWPVPFLTRWAWRSLPSELLVVTNQWPMERFYVLLAALAVFIIAQAFSRYPLSSAWQRKTMAAFLLGGCLWSASESFKFFRRAAEIAHSETASEEMHLPENLTLSRTHSYEYLGMPAYYSNGHMDPRLETRLLDSVTLRPFADGSTLRPGQGGQVAGERTLALKQGKDGILAERIQVEPGQAFILRFDFLGRSLEGELQVKGGSLYDFYTLPFSGMAQSFGSAPDSPHTLIVENTTRVAEEIRFQFIGRGGGGDGDVFARVSIEPLSEADRAIRLESLTPFHALVSAERDGYLETPQLYVPGYSASVDGAPATLARSPNGLVEVPLSAGEHDVSVVYVGSRLLRLSYFGSASAWLALLGIVSSYALGSGGTPAGPLARELQTWALSAWNRKYGRPALGSLVLAIAAGIWWHGRPAAGGDYGIIHLMIKLPTSGAGRTEPLVTTGHAGAGDFVYLTYLDGGHVAVGHDKWNYGGGKSGPIAVSFAMPQRIEISLGSLYPGSGGPKRVIVKWNGAVVYSEEAAAYPSKPSEVTVGQNAIGGSTTQPRFTGEILDVSRGDAK
jgi:hypothetical protein